MISHYVGSLYLFSYDLRVTVTLKKQVLVRQSKDTDAS